MGDPHRGHPLSSEPQPAVELSAGPHRRARSLRDD